MNVAAGAVVGGKYRLIRAVSRGGMGSVWAARHVHLGSVVAVKFMDPSFVGSPAFRARFEREARASASLQSPHVVAVQDYGIDGAMPYIVMELLQGEDLHTRLESRGRITVEETSSLLNQLGKALRRAHEIGLVHRDLKPRNIFLARVDEEEIAKILDFGIAKTLGSELVGESTKTGEIVGSPHFMSPEQFRAEKDLDARSDLWSLGVILFRCLTGQLPFAGDALTLVMVKIMVDPIPLASQMAPDLPPALDGFFLRAFARDRTQRFQSVREMVDAFGVITGSQAGWTGPRGMLGSMPGTAPELLMAPAPAAIGGTLANAEMPTAVLQRGGRRAQLIVLAGVGVTLLLGAGAVVALIRVLRPDTEPAAAIEPSSAAMAATDAATAQPAPEVTPAPPASSAADEAEPPEFETAAPTAPASASARAALPAATAQPGGKKEAKPNAAASSSAQETVEPPKESWGF